MRPFNLEFRFIKADGSTGYADLRADFVFEDGEPILVYGTIQDITELIILENEQSQEGYRRSLIQSK